MLGSLIAILGMVGLLVLWIYYNFPPAYADEKALRVFNLCVVAVCALLCGGFVWEFKTEYASDDEIETSLVNQIAIAGALGIEGGFLLVCFLLRNFWIFKATRRPYI